ncbi:hypothetical protein Dimus_006548 [Dionaea muscipula]
MGEKFASFMFIMISVQRSPPSGGQTSSDYEQTLKDINWARAYKVEKLGTGKELDRLRIEHYDALKVIEKLMNQNQPAEEATRLNVPEFFCTLSFSEIKEATNKNDTGGALTKVLFPTLQ